VAGRSPYECLSLPIFPGVRQSAIEQVVDAIAAYFARE